MELMPFFADDIGKIVQSLRTGLFTTYSEAAPGPYFMYGHRQEIAARLNTKDQSKSKKTQKYPLFALRTDFPEYIDKGVWHATLNIAIVTYTTATLNAEERMAQVFKPVLYPLYQRFLNQFQKSGLFFWPVANEMKFPVHTKWDRSFYGTPATTEANVKNIFTDPLDGIELVDLKLSKRIKC